MGSVRHVCDIRADDMTSESQGILNAQTGESGFATQQGMSMGGIRHAGDLKAGSMSRSEEHTSELQSPVPISYAVFCLKKKKKHTAYIMILWRSTENTS